MERRTFVIGAGGAGAAIIGGAVVFGGSAAAEVSDYRFNGDTIRGESDDGSVDDVRASADSIGFKYDGLNDPASSATVELRVVHGGDVETIDDATRDDISGTSQSSVPLGDTLDGSILDHPGLEASDFEADGDGSSSESDITIRLEVTIETTGGNEVDDRTEADLMVIMQNTRSDGDVGGEVNGEVVTDYETIATSDDGWVTLLADFGDETRFRIELDDSVYSDWPDNGDQYFQEVHLKDVDAGPADSYRLGFHGGDGEEEVGHGGYVKLDDENTHHVDDTSGITATESDNQHTYVFTVDHGESHIPPLPSEINVEAWGLDGGEGIGNTDRDESTGTVYYNVE